MSEGYRAVVDGYLAIYLNDQLAMGVLWRELARRSARSNRGTPFGDAIAEVADGIAEDVDTFRHIMQRVGVRTNPVKSWLAVGAERLGRFKPNGGLMGYTPLSRFVELEILVMGIEGKKQLWTTLGDLAGLRARVPDIDFDGLMQRAEHQRASLDPLRQRAGREAFTTAQRS